MKGKVVVAGGSGFLGSALANHFRHEGYEVRVLSRNSSSSGFVRWDGVQLGPWCDELEGCRALVNLVGRSVDCRYTPKNREEILKSRIDSTKLLGKAIRQCQTPPEVWLNSSTSTIYDDTRDDAPANCEEHGVIGDDFSMNVAKVWEKTFFEQEYPNTIQTAMRIAIVLGKEGGAFPIMSRLAKLGLCSPHGKGDQWVSWIHIEDFCRAVLSLIENPTNGIVNICTPNPIRNAQLNALLKKHHRPWLVLPQPKWLLELGAILIRTQTELILKSRKVAPARLLKREFRWQYPDASEAVAKLI